MSQSLRNDMPWLSQASAEELRRTVEALYHVHSLIAAITDLDTLLLRIAEESRQVARAEASSVMLYNPATDELYFQVAIGTSGDQEKLKQTVRLKLGQGIAGATAATRQSIHVKDVRTDPRFYAGADAASDFRTRNLLAVPMVDRDNLVGVLEVVNKVGADEFTTLDRHALEMFSALAASSVTNARLIEEQIRTERLAAIGQAVTGLSHYTKNIVTGLNSSADLIDMGLQSNNLDVLQRTWPAFRRSTKRISNFVQDMLSFSKPRVPVRERFEVASLIEEAKDTFGELFARKNVHLDIDTTAVNAPIYVDGQAIYRCLLNLLTNAADAVPREGGRIRVQAATLPEGAVEIIVSDNGHGVLPEHRDRIFDPFFSTKGSQGTGLGLAVTAKVVREHGGEIHLVETSPSGATFRMMLPRHAPPRESMLAYEVVA
ncbi:MAG: GAF domain-containing protein [Candidatus Hydrogenedentes bacterium]|nr:GAF domain-containing protein [Candidatus Hydrogenedentota bacterium]